MRFLITAAFVLFSFVLKGQEFTRADSLRGALSPLRTCYDITYYHLDLKVNIEEKFISGSNLFRFKAATDFNRLQFDLFANLKVDRVTFRGKDVPFTREFNAVYVDFPGVIRKGTTDEFRVFYSGNPVIASRAPWDGGFVFSQDQNGKPWVGVACQGLGASSWWPNKDHQSDEVDSMMITLSAPKGLAGVSNGRLRSTDELADGYTRFTWAVTYPINNYAVSINIADYTSFKSTFQGEKGPLSLEYYVLKGNLERARKQFSRDVPRMLKSFEHWFGPYPFYRDGFKLIETPYLGMEHQSGIAYGNKYQVGYLGSDLSGTGHGLKWDYIIIHEAGHEWFGNNITSKDIADMWIHEGFTTYSEGLFVESEYGKQAGAEYIAGQRQAIRNDKPMIGPYHVNTEGSSDIYFKGANLLHTIRHVIGNDQKWRTILRGLNREFGLKTVTTKRVEDYIIRASGVELSKIFDQYLRHQNIPVLEIRTAGGKTFYRWKTDVEGFNMPLKMKGNQGQVIRPNSQWQSIASSAFSPDTLNYYIEIREVK